MYLKRIELAGFKSFASRTKIEFEPGMTAIVGPNGSGKSNITEAIRWVMGEQSAKNLRGDKMNDIIFAGTKKRSPLNIAEVTLVIDNSDHFLPIQYTEVSITRRLNRAGDSDFMINQQPCRLRDIISLFTDSGLGKHSFAMISQGRVAEIFENKPEDRRYLFEEAAGVLKYKQRKMQAERKLGETEENLDRIEDILYELEQQLAPLEQQAKTAKQYKEWHQRYVQLDQSLVVDAIHRWKQSKEESQWQLKRLLQQKEELEQQQLDCRDVMEQLQEAIQSYDQIQEQKHQEQLQLVEQLEKIESSRQLLKERHQFKTQTKEAVIQRQEQDKQEEASLHQRLAVVQQKQEQNEAQEQQLLVKKKGLQAQTKALMQLEKVSLSDLQAQYFDLMQEQSNQRNQLQMLAGEYEQERKQRERQEQQVLEYQAQREALMDTITANKDQIAQLNEQSLQLTNQLQEAQQLLTELAQRTKEKAARYRNAQRIYEKAQAQLESLEHVQKQRTGLIDSVKFVLAQPLSGVIGVVAEQIQVPAKLTEAIEGALGANIQNIIVENESVAKEAIQQLRKERIGQATFLPLNVMKGRHLAEDFLTKCVAAKGYIGIASELIRYDDRIANVIQSLLGQYIVMEDIDTAVSLARQISHHYPIVTLKGDIIRQGGAMTGGKRSRNGLLTQSKQLAQLKDEMDAMQEKMQREQQSVQRMETKKETLQSTMTEQKAMQEVNQQKIQQLYQEIQQLEKQLHQLQQEQDFVATPTTKIDAEYEARRQQMESVLTELAAKITHKKQEIDLFDQKNEERIAAQNELNEQRHEVELQLSLVEKEKQYLAEQQQQVQQQCSEVQKRIQQSLQQLEHLADQHPEQTEKSLGLQIEQTKQQLQAVEALLARQKKDNQQRQQSLQQYQNEWNKQDKQLQEIKLTQQKQQMMMDESHHKIEEGLQYIQNHYHETFEVLAKRAITVGENEVAQRRQLKQRMDQLGDINMQAIEQYDEVYERYSFIQQQHDDLLLAKHQLKETMDEMDQQVKEKFLTTFQAASEAFSTLFPQIFGGGKAQLKLTQPDQLLETGIEIEAQPPGKKLQTLTLLSGGEQALTAITLLFAILKVKPTPFCVLDEVDAALDNANITRLGRYLKMFDQQTQFIMITHRKGIMEAADTLYGVTMTEPGVSDVLSIRLEEVS